MKKGGSLLDLTNGRAICINHWIACFDITRYWVGLLPKKPDPRHPGFDRRNLRLRGRHLRRWAAASERKKAETEPQRCRQTIAEHDNSSHLS
jgi:hypothetical protein